MDMPLGSFDAEVPAEVKRIVKSTYSPDDLKEGAQVLVTWLKAGPSEDYSKARAAHLVFGDGQPYAATKEGEDGRREATKAGQRFRTLINHLIATTSPGNAKSGRIIVVTGKHPTAANAFSWGAYWAPYAEPVVRKPKAEKPAAA